MKLFTKSFDSTSRLKCYLFHADPDELLRLGRPDGAGGTTDPAESEDETSRRFNLILHDTRLGGIWKRTGHDRLGGTMQLIHDHITGAQRAATDILDVGASDGTTTIELLEYLRARGHSGIKITMADKYLWLYRFQRGPIVEYRSHDGQPALARLGRFGLRLPRSEHSWHLPANLLATGYMGLERFRSSMRMTHKIRLLNPRIVRYPEIEALEMDCLQRSPDLAGKMDVIRLSNVLNPQYFDQRQTIQCLANMHAYLRHGGCVVVSRNAIHGSVEVERGSLWTKAPGGFVHQADFGGGSEIKSLVASVTIPAT